ncbi:MAG: hypothetical protein Q7U51_03265, partial [Methanoregula sp.]|nr:hypothetical protein [Methanoregula sp.]
CPYCGKEFLDFEQIGSGIDFRHHLYKDFLILPVEKAVSFPYLIRNRPFGKQQHLENIKCSSCCREFAIALLPFGMREISESNARSVKQPNEVNPNFFVSLEQRPVFEIFSNWKIFLGFNYFLIIALITTMFTRSLFLGISIYLVLASEFLLIRYLAEFSKEFDKFLDIENMPVVLNESYKKSRDFVKFKKMFSNPSNLKQKDTGRILKIGLLLALILFGASMNLSPQNFLIRDLPGLIYFVIIEPGLFLFFFFFSLLLTTILFVLLDALDYLTLISTKMLLRLDPWETTQKIEDFKRFWKYSLGLYIFSSIVFPFFLNYNAINTVIENYRTPQILVQLLLPMLMAPFAILSIAVNTAVVIIFIAILFSFDTNIKLRKHERTDEIKRRLAEIESKHDPSNEDVVKSEMMIKEMELIETIPQFFWKLSAIPLIFDALSIGIFLYNLFFPVK